MDDLERVGSVKYEEFFRDYLEANQLCIFSSELTKHWRSRKEWVSDGRPNLVFLSTKFGHAIAPVANCCQTKYSNQVKQDMSVHEFCDYWRSKSQGDEECAETLYLKDWHFCKTPFHADVFRSYSWSANICGCKKWLFYAPGQETYLTDRLGNLAYDITSGDMNDRLQFPDFEKASKPITVIQREGEVIFVPSGWHHQVINLEDTISINHNWINACGIFKMWEHLQNELVKVKQSIEDCKDMEHWHQQCQVILRASCGMDFKEFIEFLDVIAKRRMCSISERATDSNSDEKYRKDTKTLAGTEFLSSVFQDWKKSIEVLEGQQQKTFTDYCRYDLMKIKECLVSLQDDQSFIDLQNEDLQFGVNKLLHDIDTSLEKYSGNI